MVWNSIQQPFDQLVFDISPEYAADVFDGHHIVFLIKKRELILQGPNA